MAKLQRTTVSRRTVEALAVAKDTVFWDSELPGFGVRVYPSGRKMYVVQTRAGGKAAKRVTIGRHGVITAEEARRRAALAIARIKGGEEPALEPVKSGADKGPSVAELAAAYLEEHVAVRCKPATARGCRILVEKHILPALGRRPAAAVGHGEVAELHHRLARTPAAANGAVQMLSRIYGWAEDRGAVPEGGNPCRDVARYRTRRRERFLTDGEFRRLGRVLDEAETEKGPSVHALAAIRLLLLTGCRKTEILTLRWDRVDLEARELRLADAKTGAFFLPVPVSSVQCHTVPN
ncbi:MAG: integrase arm-type DNA-binding domain-containing protein [Rhodospirillaceae bacterium]|nr:integrase arm-type DNA-binding domain-containing protein [Rhodospirillaceae bacterium]